MRIVSLLIITLILSCEDYCNNKTSSNYSPPINTDEWSTIPPDELGWDIEKLDKVVQWVGDHRTCSFIILHKGRIVIEEHWGGWNIYKRIKIASITKSITSVLIGIAQQKELLNINNFVSDFLGEGWSNASNETESKITIKHLLSMTSGLDEYMNSIFEPGSNFFYGNTAFYRLWLILEEATGQKVEAFAYEVLFKKIGMSEAIHWTKGGRILPRDLARFGLFMINEGVWSENEIIKDYNYFNYMINPSQDYAKCYGYLWWLNFDCNYNNDGEELLLFPDATSDTYAACGAWDQRLFVVPSEDLVIIRLGFDNQLPFSGEESFNTRFWKLMSQVII